MCGIYFSSRADDFRYVQKKLDVIESRGPDNVAHMRHSNFVIGHRRLAILDTSSLADQPFESHAYSLTYNGEIYNFLALRKKYLAEVEFVSDSDTEVLFHLLCRNGEQILNELEGMFAFVFINNESGEIIAARDRFGQKPLVYFKDEYGVELASTALQIGCNKRLELDQEACRDVIFSKRVRGNKTIYENILKVPPGGLLKGNIASNDLVAETWYKCDFQNDMSVDIIEYLKKSISKRLVSDVPVGAYLSGGVDSSIVSALAYEQSKDICGFGIGFTNEVYDESKHILEVSKKIGLSTEVRKIGKHSFDYHEMIELYVKHCDEPFADDSLFAMFKLAEMSRESLTVVLTGDAADELFLGYERYLHISKAWSVIKLVPLRNHVAFLLRLIGTSWAQKLSHKLSAKSLLDLYHKSSWISDADYFISGRNDSYFPNNPLTTNAAINPDCLTSLSLYDLQTYVPEDINYKVDRATMAYSIEARSPFLDHILVEKALGLPLEDKIKNGVQKVLLKDWLSSRYRIKSVYRKKQGFKFNTNDYRDEINTVLHSDCARYISKIVDIDILKLEKRMSESRDVIPVVVWNFVMLCEWTRKNQKCA